MKSFPKRNIFPCSEKKSSISKVILLSNALSSFLFLFMVLPKTKSEHNYNISSQFFQVVKLCKESSPMIKEKCLSGKSCLKEFNVS